ncbi:rho GTPase activator Rga- variant, partial [Apiospora kogelbergensis]
MDPLSVTASVAGLLSAAAKIYSLLDAIASAKNAPKTIRNAQAEVRQFELTLRSLRRYLWQLELVDTRRRDLICLDEIIVPLADAMLELSEFEKLLDKLTNLNTLRSFVTWFSYYKTVEEHLARITRQKTSLVMILNIIQCESDQEAFRSQRQLQDLVGKILSENKVLKGKLEQLEDSFDSRSTLMPQFDHDTRSSNHDVTDDIDDGATIRGNDQHNTVQNARQGALEFAFETVLEQSWVYQRNTNRNCDCSFVSSVQRSHAWSVFSEYSLADISVLSVIAMPITAIDVSNGIYYTAVNKASVPAQSDGWPLVTDINHDLPEGKDTQQPDDEPSPLDNDNEERITEADDELSPCNGCDGAMEEGEALLAGYRWHLDCLCCQSCSKLLDGDADFSLVSNGSLLCSDCMYSCVACGCKIEKLAILTGDWAFCASCFCCRK